MKTQSKIESMLFLLGGALMVIGAGCFAFMWQQRVFCWVFLLGAVLFATMQMMQTYEGGDVTVKRLKRIQTLADIAFILSGILMADNAYRFLLPLFERQGVNGYYNYLQYIYNKWVVVLLVAAILEIYTTHRLASEFQKAKKT